MGRKRPAIKNQPHRFSRTKVLWRAVIVGAVLVALGALVLWLAVRFTLGRVVGATLVLAGLCRWRAMM